MLSRFDRIPDDAGRTDRENCYINIVRQIKHDSRDHVNSVLKLELKLKFSS